MLLGTVLVLYLTSCYNNKKEMDALPKVSFMNEVVPIVTSGACGCHNNGALTRAVQWSNLYKINHGLDTINYNVILARASALDAMAKGGEHPGKGGIVFTPSEAKTIRDWVAQGASDDGGSVCNTPVTVTYTNNISPMVATTCNGGSCHGGLGPVLNQAKLISTKTKLQDMIAIKGAGTSHPGGILTLSKCTWSLLDAWIQQGMN